MVYGDSAELHVQSFDQTRIEGESIIYTAQLPFFTRGIIQKVNERPDRNEWIIKKDRSLFNKLHILEWWLIAVIMIPILIPVMFYLSIENYFKSKKYDVRVQKTNSRSRRRK
jgi:hypothetical protein